MVFDCQELLHSASLIKAFPVENSSQSFAKFGMLLLAADGICVQKVCDMACGLLDALLHTNIHYFLLEQYSAAPFIQNTSGNGPSLEAWLSVREPKGFEKDVKRLGPKWHIPNREGVSFF